MKTPLSSLIILCALLLAGAGSALAQATVATDRAEYLSGSTVNITGAGFQPGNSAATTQACPDFATSPPGLNPRPES